MKEMGLDDIIAAEFFYMRMNLAHIFLIVLLLFFVSVIWDVMDHDGFPLFSVIRS